MNSSPQYTEAADFLRLRKNTLEVWRVQGRGPAFLKLGSRVVYDREELEAFAQTCQRKIDLRPGRNFPPPRQGRVSHETHAGGRPHPRNPPGGDGFVRFYISGPGGKPSPLPSIPLPKLRQCWAPDLVERLSTDAWMTLNTFWRADTARQEDLRYLNACFVDCDYYKHSSIGFPEAVGGSAAGSRAGPLASRYPSDKQRSRALGDLFAGGYI